MIVVRGAFRVTVRTLKHAVVVRIGMAGRAHSICSPVAHREVRVIEGGVQPGAGRVTGRATGREAGRHVVGIRGSLIVGSMATVTVRRQRRVVIVHMTIRAGHGGVRARERE